MKLIKIILTIICFGASSFLTEGKDSLMFHNVSHRITGEFRPAYNMPTHGYYRGYNETDTPVCSGCAAHLKYGFRLNPDSHYGRLYPTAYQGIGIGLQSFLQHDMIGTPLLLYVFQGGKIAQWAKKFSLGYEWNLGASYGWRINKVVSSRWNVYINIAMPLTWHISSLWEVSLAPEYTHFSNGDTSFPNGGANTIGCRIGLTARINEHKSPEAPGKALVSKDVTLAESSFPERMSYDLAVFGGWRADRTVTDKGLKVANEVFPTAGLNFNALYHLNRYFCAGAAIDLLYDRSADISIDEDIRYPEVHRQLSCGLSVNAELTMPFFSVNVGTGYAFSSGHDMTGFYSRYTLKTFITKNLFLNIGYRLSSVLYSHNLMLGIGVRL